MSNYSKNLKASATVSTQQENSTIENEVKKVMEETKRKVLETHKSNVDNTTIDVFDKMIKDVINKKMWGARGMQFNSITPNATSENTNSDTLLLEKIFKPHLEKIINVSPVKPCSIIKYTTNDFDRIITTEDIIDTANDDDKQVYLYTKSHSVANIDFNMEVTNVPYNCFRLTICMLETVGLDKLSNKIIEYENLYNAFLTTVEKVGILPNVKEMIEDYQKDITKNKPKYEMTTSIQKIKCENLYEAVTHPNRFIDLMNGWKIIYDIESNMFTIKQPHILRKYDGEGYHSNNNIINTLLTSYSNVMLISNNHDFMKITGILNIQIRKLLEYNFENLTECNDCWLVSNLIDKI